VRAALIAIFVLLLLTTGARRKYTSVRAELVQQREAMSEAWAQVDSALQKRAELVPSMVEAVKAVSNGGNPVFHDLEDARTALLNGRSPEERIQANEKLNGALSRLLSLSKTYPRLKSSRNFALMEAEMADAESRIAIPRRKYNEALEHYNAQIQQFPENVVASIAGFARNDAYLKTEPGRAPMKAP
jgi:LemA protein